MRWIRKLLARLRDAILGPDDLPPRRVVRMPSTRVHRPRAEMTPEELERRSDLLKDKLDDLDLM